MKRISLIIIGLLLIFFCYSLSEAQKTKTVEGVQVISNGKKPNPQEGQSAQRKLAEEVTIGKGDNPDESVSEVGAMIVDENGNIYALDSKDRRVKVFDKTGKFLRFIGKPGQGPGELGIPTGIQFTLDHNLLIEDATNRRLAFFKPSGEFIKNISTADKLGLVNILLDAQGNFLAREMSLDGKKAFFEIKKYDQNLKPLFTLDKMEFPIPLPGSSTKMKIMEMISIYQVDGKGNIFYGRSTAYEIKVFNPEGKHIRTIEKEYDPIKISQEDIDEMLQRMSSAGTGVNFKDMVEFPKNFPPFQYFILDDEGRIYVRTWKKGEGKGEYEFDVFDAEGRFIAQFTTTADLRLWQNGKAYGVEETEDGFRVIKRYTLENVT